MNLDPQRFFIGLMDFFSILLPGALVTYLLMGEVGPVVLRDRYATLAGAEAWAAFLFASYLLGHLFFLLGSWLDELDDRARRYTLNMQITLHARRGRLLPWFARTLMSGLSGACRRLAQVGMEGLVIEGRVPFVLRATYRHMATGPPIAAARKVYV